MDIVQKLRSVIGYYKPVEKQDISERYSDHEMSNFLKLIEEVNWSRGYGWFVEMEDAPPPFNGSAIGLPAIDVTFVSINSEEYSWDSSTSKHYVPKCRGGEEMIQLNLIDDEQATLYTFFENWMNDIYDLYNGVLPLSEACKKITIHRFTSERYRVRRKVRGKNVEGYTYFVYPFQNIAETLSSTDNEPVKFTVSLRIASQLDLTPGIVNDAVSVARSTVEQNYEYVPY